MLLSVKKRKWIGVVLVLCVLFIAQSNPFQQFISIPTELRLFEGNSAPLALSVGSLTSADSNIVDVQQTADSQLQIDARSPGTTDVRMMLGHIPLKKTTVNVLPETKVYVGGQTIGVKLHSVGALVVGHHFIETEEGKVSPGEQAKIQTGDIIVKINGEEITELEQINDILDEHADQTDPVKLEIMRGKETFNINITPIYDEKAEKYRLGLYIRNSAAGVGTLTFVDPKSGAYGALGHIISDTDTQKPIIVDNGSIVDSKVSSIEKGKEGNPGEKYSSINEAHILGDIQKNTPFGIFGKMKVRMLNGVRDEPVPIGLSEEVEVGPAQILTVVNGQKVEAFDIEIVDAMDQRYPATKGLVIKVTDEKLLEQTGGIVQGMSGSPIIQNGKLIGAVTHVFVNDPTSGYGCFIEWMLQDAGVPLQPKNQVKPKAS